jgi:outer membrane protein assembly factor BamD (BamD/ComL family)
MGDYVAAIEAYEDYLRFVPDGDRTDQVLFHVGMAYALRTQPPANWRQATASLRRLIYEYPDSPLKPTARLILSLRSDADQLANDAKARNQIVQQLRMQLERLKKIDADRVKP